MTHPTQLHAAAALWSLDATRDPLRQAQERATAAVAEDGDRGTLQAWRPGSGAGGVYSDPISRAVAMGGATTTAATRYGQLAANVAGTVRWLVAAIVPDHDPTRSALTQLRDAVPRLGPAIAENLTHWIDEADRNVRAALQLGNDHEDLVGVECPFCGARRLATRTSPPPGHRVVVCAAGCTCTGPGCPCRMSAPYAGVTHVWTTAELRAVTEPKEDA